eukprot:jgi/Mesvir1/12372/Mv00553-RA.1
MKNHVIGQRYSQATVNALDATSTLRGGADPSSRSELLDRRPQGRDFLYAQTSRPDALGDEPMGMATAGRPARASKTASLPEPRFYERPLITRKLPSEDIPDEIRNFTGRVPGFTGHLHASQHVYAKSYGGTTKLLAEEEETTRRSRALMNYSEDRPTGPLADASDKRRIPGYGGYVPVKNNHVFGKTFGSATSLASTAERAMRSHSNASAMAELVDTRPQGRADLFAQSHDMSNAPPREYLTPSRQPRGHTSGGRVGTLGGSGSDYGFASTNVHTRATEPVTEDMREVLAGRHRVVGYTGHLHGNQHIYARSYGKMSRELVDEGGHIRAEPTRDDLLFYRDDRPQNRRW